MGEGGNLCVIFKGKGGGATPPKYEIICEQPLSKLSKKEKKKIVTYIYPLYMCIPN